MNISIKTCIGFFFIAVFLHGCSPKPYQASNKTYRKKAITIAKTIKAIPYDNALDSSATNETWIGTVNFGMRKPNFVIIHHTAQNGCEQTLSTFTKDSSQVSAHYLICKDGTIHHLLNDYLRAWHAGLGKWGNNTDINSASIGIELDNNGFENFTDIQLQRLNELLAVLKSRYNIPAANFIGHADIAPSRKVDPNIYFPWKQLATKGFGLWYDDTTAVKLPMDFNPSLALRIIGYDIANDTAAIQAFRRHFLQTETTGELSEPEKKVLYAVMKKYL